MRSTFLRYLMATLLILVLLALAWFWLTLHWSYSEGERAGYVQKLQRHLRVGCLVPAGKDQQDLFAGWLHVRG